jgi:8-oxo-dGTP pyrophosphatase MutT (NUDIX family)
MSVFNTPYKTQVFSIKPKDFDSNIHVAACYIRSDNKYLLLHRSVGKPQELSWGVPAGKVEKGESAREAVIRETWEETNIRLDNNILRELGVLYIRYPHVDFVYHMFAQDFLETPVVILSPEHCAYLWVNLEDINKLPLISGAREAFDFVKEKNTKN